MMPRSTPFWLAMGERLIQFFGGKMIFNDCEDHDDKNNYLKHRGCYWKNANDGLPWQKKQQAIYDLEPITKKDLLDWNKYASYPMQAGEKIWKEQPAK